MSKTPFQTVKPGPDAPVEAVVICDSITLRLGKLASIAVLVRKISGTMQETDPNRIWDGIEMLAESVEKELESISNEVSALYDAGGAR